MENHRQPNRTIVFEKIFFLCALHEFSSKNRILGRWCLPFFPLNLFFNRWIDMNLNSISQHKFPASCFINVPLKQKSFTFSSQRFITDLPFLLPYTYLKNYANAVRPCRWWNYGNYEYVRRKQNTTARPKIYFSIHYENAFICINLDTVLIAPI